MSDIPYAPRFMFASPAGPWMRFFAWKPRRMYDGRVLWLRYGWRRLVAIHSYLPNGGDTFWCYTDHTKEGR
jgi:hypothetical protein